MKKLLAFGVLLCLMAVSMAQSSPFDVTYSTYKTGKFSKVQSFIVYTLRSQQEFAQYWSTTTSNPAVTVPNDIDWLHNEVLAIHLGQRPTDGYSVGVDDISLISGNNYRVSVVEHIPARHDEVASRKTSPYIILLLPRRYATYTIAKSIQESDGGDGRGTPQWHPLNCKCCTAKCTCCHGDQKDRRDRDGDNGGGSDSDGGGVSMKASSNLVLASFDVNADKVPFKILRSGNLGAGPKRLTLVAIRSEDDWAKYWRETMSPSAANGNGVRGGKGRKAPPSHVDFSKSQLLAIHLGERPTSGYMLQISGVSKMKGGFRVDAMEIKPSGATLQVLTYPYALIQLPGKTGKFQLDMTTKSAKG